MEFIEQEDKAMNLDMILKAFEKINNALDEQFLSEVVKEMIKIMPLNNSRVVVRAGYGEEDNEMAITFYVSKPKDTEISKNLSFMEVITALFIKTDFDMLEHIWNCINHLEKKGDNYKINGTEVYYNQKLGDYIFNLFISKE